MLMWEAGSELDGWGVTTRIREYKGDALQLKLNGLARVWPVRQGKLVELSA